jgi:hypothetical protein
MHELLTLKAATDNNLWVRAIERHEFLVDAITDAIKAAVRENSHQHSREGDSRLMPVEIRLGLAATLVALVGAENLEAFIAEMRWIAESNGWEYL